jgi:hypothetical protein
VIDNFNNVFRLSSGEYFKWAACDDLCGRDYLSPGRSRPGGGPVDGAGLGEDRWDRRARQRVPLPYQVSDMNSAESVYSPDPTVRFPRLLRNFWWVGGPFYGVTRSMTLAATRWLHPRHMSGDAILLT